MDASTLVDTYLLLRLPIGKHRLDQVMLEDYEEYFYQSDHLLEEMEIVAVEKDWETDL